MVGRGNENSKLLFVNINVSIAFLFFPFVQFDVNLLLHICQRRLLQICPEKNKKNVLEKKKLEKFNKRKNSVSRLNAKIKQDFS